MDGIKIVLFIILLLVTIGMCTYDVYAHKWTMLNGEIADAGWIEENHRACCGKEDCFPVPIRDIKLTREGWKVKGHPNIIPENTVIPSEDGKAWKCVKMLYPKKPIRCLFLPGAGV